MNSAEAVLTEEQKAEFDRKYAITSDSQKTYGQILLGIMDKLKIDEKDAEELTGLNYKYFYRNVLEKPDGKIEKRFVVSIGVGFGFDSHITEYILESCGLKFNTNDRVDKAYIYLLEEHKDKDWVTCNIILSELGIDKKHYLGSHERGSYSKSD